MQYFNPLLLFLTPVPMLFSTVKMPIGATNSRDLSHIKAMTMPNQEQATINGQIPLYIQNVTYTFTGTTGAFCSVVNSKPQHKLWGNLLFITADAPLLWKNSRFFGAPAASG
ncbi:hypothetical protein [Thiolapillus sp.]